MIQALSDPEVLGKLEKGLSQLATSIRTLSKVCGLISDSVTRNSPTSTVAEEPPEEKAPEAPQPPPTLWEPRMTVREFLLHDKCNWSRAEYSVMRLVVDQDVRADTFRNQWVKDPAAKKGYRKISEPTLRRIHDFVDLFLQQAQDYVKHDCGEVWETFAGKDREGTLGPGHFLNRNWVARCRALRKATLPYEQFLKFARDVHDDLPPLRG